MREFEARSSPPMPIVPDANTGLEALAAAQTAKTFLGPIAERVLGPTADYLGQGLRGWTEKQRENTRRIFEKADARLTDERPRRGGSVPPKVLKAVLDDGAFCDDELAAEYFGGVLASSRSEVSRDDRGATLASLVGRLSSYEIRTHYLLYAHAQRRLAGSSFNLGLDTDRQRCARVYLPMDLWVDGMEFTPMEAPMIGDIINGSVQGLLREDLIELPFAFGGPEVMQNVGFGNRHGLGAQLSPLGVQLFVWAHGRNTSALTYFLRSEADFSMPGMLDLEEGALVLADINQPASPPE